MTNEQCKRICVERLSDWAGKCAEQHTTPVALIAVGHDNRAGQILVLTVDSKAMSKEALAELFAMAGIGLELQA